MIRPRPAAGLLAWAATPILVVASILAAVQGLAREARAGARVGGPAPATGLAARVIVISVDGMRWDHPRLAGARSLERMAREGATAAALVPPFPASTFPAHATLATGVHPDRHGILNNEFLDRKRGPFERADDAGWLLAEPVWSAAERQGVRTAVFHWVGSYTPWRGTAASRRMPFTKETRDRDKAVTIARWMAETGPDAPRLILSYWHGPDAAGHEHGPTAPATLDQVRHTDRLIGRLLEAAAARPGTALIVVSDHGMAAVDRVIRLNEILVGDAGRSRAIATGATTNVYCRHAPACAAAAAALATVPGLELFRVDDLPPGWRYRLADRTGDLVAVAPAGAYFAEGPSTRPPARGMHGYAPGGADMHGIFFAWGSGIRPGARRERLHAVDVAPLVCRLAGFTCPEGVEGSVPEDLLDSGARITAPAR